MARRLKTFCDPAGSRSVIVLLPEPAQGQALELAKDWTQVRGLAQAPAPYTRPAQRMSSKAASLLAYLGLHGQQGHVIDEAICRTSGGNVRAFAGLELDGLAQFWSIEGGLPQITVDEFDVITFVTGLCLFSVPAVRVLTSNGSFDLLGESSTLELAARVRSIVCARDLTAYELESAARLTWTIVQLMQRLPTGDGPKIRVVLDVPRTHYYLYILDGALNGFITPQLCLDWFDEVDRRSQRVVNLCKELLRVMPGSRAAQVDVTVSAELKPVADYLRAEIDQGRVPPIRHIVLEQYDHGSRFWRMLQTSGLPDSVIELNARTYGATLLQESTSDDVTRRLAIQVDNPSEGRIYATMKRAARTHPQLPVNCISVLPLDLILAAKKGDDNGRIGMYQNDPGHQLVSPDGTESTVQELLNQHFPRTPRI